MTEYLNDKIGPDEMVAICWLYATVKFTDCKCHLFEKNEVRNVAQLSKPMTECVRCTSLRMARVAWPFTVGFIEETK
jgi:hypothetical protein